MSYCMRKASDILPVNVDLYSPEAVASQFLYIQRCSGKQLDTKAYHYILSFATQKYENFVSVDDIKAIMAFFAHDFLQKHQAVLCLHTNKKTHYHVHIIVDPVSFYNYHKFRNNMQCVFCKTFLHKIAKTFCRLLQLHFVGNCKALGSQEQAAPDGSS